MSDPLHPTQSLRRRAAVAVLSDQLDDPALLQALWLQHDQMRGDAVTDIIRFIDQVAQQCGLDAGSCRRLYSEYFKALKQPSEMLPADPWSRMQALRPAPSPLPQAMAAPAVSSAPAPAVPLAQAMPVASPASAVVINPVATALASAAARHGGCRDRCVLGGRTGGGLRGCAAFDGRGGAEVPPRSAR